MSARVWQAVAALAQIWRGSEVVRGYGSAALGYGAEAMYPSAGHIDAQPFYLSHYIHTRVAFGDDLDIPTQTTEWADVGANLARAYTILIEFLRSRLPGYPFADMPQMSDNSHWTDLTVAMTVPWLPFGEWNMQDRRTPPIFPEIAIDLHVQGPAMWELTKAFQDCPAARAVGAAWQALSDADHAQLANARAAFDQMHYPQRAGQVTSDEDFRRLAWTRTQLDTITSRLEGRAKTFCDTLTAADRFLQQAAALFSHLVFYRSIRLLDNIELVEQLDGTEGWYTVRSAQFVFQPFRIHEIVGFCHPYPRGLMMVQGTVEELPSGAHSGAIALHGRILPDSVNLTEHVPTALA